MFSAAFKNSLTERRHAVRVAAGVEQMELSEGRDAWQVGHGHGDPVGLVSLVLGC